MPTEREDIVATIREELAKELAKTINDGDPAPAPAKPEPLTINVAGQTYQFENKEQMEAALTRTFQTFKEQIEAKPAPDSREGAYVSGKEATDAFDEKKYVDLMGENALEASKYMLDHVFGMKDAATNIRQKLEEAEILKSTVSVYQFRELHPEFPMTPEATKVVDGIRRELNQPFTLQGLEAAYGVAQTRGLVPSPQLIAYQQDLIRKGILADPSAPAQEQQRPAPNSPYGFQPPPGVPRSTPVQGGDLAAVAENMTLDQLESALRRAGQL